MAVRSIAQVLAGVLAGAALVGVPAWAAASQQDNALSSSSGLTAMMSSSESQHQMMSSMSKMMEEPEMREQMCSMMSDSMGEMSGMEDGMSGHGKSEMGQMRDMDRGSTFGRSANQ